MDNFGWVRNKLVVCDRHGEVGVNCCKSCIDDHLAENPTTLPCGCTIHGGSIELGDDDLVDEAFGEHLRHNVLVVPRMFESIAYVMYHKQVEARLKMLKEQAVRVRQARADLDIARPRLAQLSAQENALAWALDVDVAAVTEPSVRHMVEDAMKQYIDVSSQRNRVAGAVSMLQQEIKGTRVRRRCPQCGIGHREVVHGRDQCTQCSARWCSRCTVLEREGHECAAADLAMVNDPNYRACPRCATPCYRAVACAHVMCSHCECLFDITSGEVLDQHYLLTIIDGYDFAERFGFVPRAGQIGRAHV